MEQETSADVRPLGAVLNPPDNRDISAATFQPTVPLAQERTTDISMLPVQNQQQNGSCVGQAEGSIVEYYWWKETGKIADVSRRYIYGMSKKLDGYNGEGTMPRVAAKIIVDDGAATSKTVPNDNSLPHAKYIVFDVTDEVKADSKMRKAQGFADVILTPFWIRQALAINGVMTLSLQVGDWDGEYVKPTYSNGANRGWHRIMVYADKVLPNGDIEFRALNSWGKVWGKSTDGTFKFLWSDYEKFCADGLVYTDIPNELLEEAHNTPFQFTKDLQRGDQSTDVTELQKRLFELGLFDDSDGFTQFYGSKTEEAVKKYQKAMGIVSSGDAATTGYGRFGSKTRAAMNAQQQIPPTFELYPKVQKMADVFLEICQISGMPIKITDAYRSKAEQDALYAIGRTVQLDKSPVTNAKGGYSFHQWHVAFDVVFLKADGSTTYDGPWEKIGRIGELLGLEWGGRWATFPDRPHFQLSLGYSIEDFINGNVDYSKFN